MTKASRWGRIVFSWIEIGGYLAIVVAAPFQPAMIASKIVYTLLIAALGFWLLVLPARRRLRNTPKQTTPRGTTEETTHA